MGAVDGGPAIGSLSSCKLEFHQGYLCTIFGAIVEVFRAQSLLKCWGKCLSAYRKYQTIVVFAVYRRLRG